MSGDQITVDSVITGPHLTGPPGSDANVTGHESTYNHANYNTAYSHSQVSHAPSDAEKNVNPDWNASSGYAQILNKPTVPTALSQLGDDSTHRLVSDTEKSTWNGKQDALGYTPVNTNDGRLSDARTPLTHSHSAADVTGTAVLTNDARLSDARTPTAHTHTKSNITDFAHTHPESDITNLTADLAGKEPANANIQTHVGSAHAPSSAQKNSDILKSEIEAVLTGEITSHTHAGGQGLTQQQIEGII
jgi:hypothetical protein